MNNQTDFDTLFDNILQEPLHELETLRVNRIKKAKVFRYISIPFFLLFLLSAIIVRQPTPIFLSLFVFIAVFGVSEMVIKNLKRELKPKFKKAILLPILRSLYEDIEYIPMQRISKIVLNKSLLINKTIHRTIGDDFVRCRVGQTMIQFSEVEGYHGRNEGMYYAGIFIAASFNKHFRTKTVVLPDRLANRMQRFLLGQKAQMKNPKIIELENPDFEKQFVVIGEDEQESRYLLTPGLMERMVDYESRFSSKVSFSFIDSKLYISIPIKKDMFEPRLLKPLNDRQIIKYNYDYFSLLTSVVEELDLNTRVWTKV